MNRIELYRQKLQQLKNWDEYLLKESGLPGPRGNIELAQAVADEGNIHLFKRYLTFTSDIAPVNSPYEFLAFCGVIGLGRLVAEGKTEFLDTIRHYASDKRWRMREGVAMALQRVGDVNIDLLLEEMKKWSYGNQLEQRAAAAALCEPRLLKEEKHAREVLLILDSITASIVRSDNRKSEGFLALKKGLGYCWSVALAALPSDGKTFMEKWMTSSDKDIRWIMKENLKKNRLLKVDMEWVEKWQSFLNI
jgi:hypothetical protein